MRRTLSCYQYDSAAEYARECGLDRTTIVQYIKEGILKAHKSPGRGGRYKLHVKANPHPSKLKKPYSKYSKAYSETEIYILLNNKGKPAKVVAKMIGRNANSVKIKRCRLRKHGYDV